MKLRQKGSEYKVRHILLMSHGLLAPAIKESAELIAGPIDHCWTYSVLADTNVETLTHEIEARLAEFAPEDEIVILCDILGGSPSNIVLHLLASHPRIQAFTGLNLGMVLELALNREAESLAQQLSHNYQSGFQELKLITEVDDTLLDL